MKTKLTIILLSMIIIPFAYSEDKNTEVKQEQPAKKQIDSSSKSSGFKKQKIDEQIQTLMLQQKKLNKSLQTLIKTLNIESTNQKTFQSKIEKKMESLHNIQNQLNDDIKQFATNKNDKNNSDTLKSLEKQLSSSINDLQTNVASVSSALTELSFKHSESFKNYQLENEKQISDLAEKINSFKIITAEQGKMYSTVTDSISQIDKRLVTLNEQFENFSNNLNGKEEVNITDILTEKFSSNEEIIKSVETNIQSLVKNTTSQLTSEIVNTIKALKNDIGRLKQNVSDEIDRINSQLLEFKHEQQQELQLITKQFSQEILQHDKNISESVLKIEESNKNKHLTWAIYGLVFVIFCLFGFIIWDRLSTVAPLIYRIQKLEDNLVIEY